MFPLVVDDMHGLQLFYCKATMIPLLRLLAATGVETIPPEKVGAEATLVVLW